MLATHPGAQSGTTWITQDSLATTVAKPALIQTNLDKSVQIRTTTTDQDLPNPTTSNHPEIHETQCFLRPDARFFLHRPGRKIFHQPPSVPIRSNRTEQPYGSINPQIAPAGSRITANRPSPSALGPSTISPPSSVTRATLESRSSTLM